MEYHQSMDIHRWHRERSRRTARSGKLKGPAKLREPSKGTVSPSRKGRARSESVLGNVKASELPKSRGLNAAVKERRFTQKQIDTIVLYREANTPMETIAELMGISLGAVHKYGKDVVPLLHEPMPSKAEIFSTVSNSPAQANYGSQQPNARPPQESNRTPYYLPTNLPQEWINFALGDMVNDGETDFELHLTQRIPWKIRMMNALMAIVPYDKAYPQTFLPIAKHLLEGGIMIEGRVQALQRERKRREEEELLDEYRKLQQS